MVFGIQDDDDSDYDHTDFDRHYEGIYMGTIL